MRTISIFGSTGSIGTSAIDVILQAPEKYKVKVLVSRNNFKLLAEQAKLLKPDLVVLKNQEHKADLEELLKDTATETAFGEQAMQDAAAIETDVFIAGIVGMAGLKTIMQAAKRQTTIALANKESLVCAGNILLQLCNQSGAKILPVDSEHNAIFQLLENADKKEFEKVILTASGGPFWNKDVDLSQVTPEQAIKHPTWEMGKKISVDSATMANKGLELIEAKHLFALTAKDLDVLIHPQSLVHGILNFTDGSCAMYAAKADMRIPISYCISYPERGQINSEKIDLTQTQLDFFQPDLVKFPALQLAQDILDGDTSTHIIYNTANEIAVESFLQGRIKFTDIAIQIEQALNNFTSQKISVLEDVFAMENMIRSKSKLQAA